MGENKEPLLQHLQNHPSSSSSYVNSPRKRSTTPPFLCPLPEHGEPPNLQSIPIPSSPSSSSSSLKDRLIFGLDLTTTTTTTLDAPDSPSNHLLHHQHSLLHRSRTAPAMAVINDFDRHPSIPKPQFASTSIVRQAFLLLILYLSLGILIYSFNSHHFSGTQTHPVVDALYFCIVTMCTIGYGDITPNTTVTKLFSITFVLVGFGFIDILLSGMVSYVLDLQESLLLSAAKADLDNRHEAAHAYFLDLKKGRVRIRMKVGLALGVVVLCIGVGTGVMHFVETLGWLDSFYLSVMSVTTVGYGDRAFKSLPGRIFASIWLLVSTLAVARAFLFLAEARIDKRHRMMAKWVLRQEMTVSEFLAADIDNNGFISKSEYVIYKLKEMGKISEKDILQICNQFDRLDTGNCGKITLADLMENYQ